MGIAWASPVARCARGTLRSSAALCAIQHRVPLSGIAAGGNADGMCIPGGLHQSCSHWYAVTSSTTWRPPFAASERLRAWATPGQREKPGRTHTDRATSASRRTRRRLGAACPSPRRSCQPSVGHHVREGTARTEAPPSESRWSGRHLKRLSHLNSELEMHPPLSMLASRELLGSEG